MRFTRATTATPSRFEGLALAVAFVLALMLLSFLRTLGDTGSMKFGTVVMRTAMETPLWGTALGASLAYFAGMQVVVHLVFGAICWVLACISQRALPRVNASRRQWVLIWLLLCTAWILIANSALFPASSLGEPYAQIAAMRVLGLQIHVLLGALILVAIVTCAVLWIIQGEPPGRISAKRMGIGGAILGCGGLLFLVFAATPSSGKPATGKQPNVIIIGIDSLRSDVALGPDATRHMPNLAGFLQRSVNFPDTITPLARTFPSWVSILTGKHPHSTGAVINLLPRDMIDAGLTLPAALRERGYQTIYAIDESRFSNVDATFGFDRVATPPFGAADFLIGTINDAPLTNLLVNSRAGEWLFPHSYANRGAAALYDPDTFIERVDRITSFKRPTFLAVHLTLMHWPFTWAGSPRVQATGEMERLREKYFLSAHRVDQQVGDLLAMLKRKGALQNAVVIVLSDHGEALGDHSETSYPYRALGESEDKLQITGHGTSVFSPNQFHVLLAARSYGNESMATQCGTLIDEPASLVDVYPTVLDALGFDAREKFDGRSLLPLLRPNSAGNCMSFDGRIRFTESEFNPQGISPTGAISASALALAKRFYDVVPSTGRMELRRENLATMLRTRQYAAMMDGTLVAAVPVFGGGVRYFAVEPGGSIPREVNGTPDATRDPLLAELWEALNRRFALRPND